MADENTDLFLLLTTNDNKPLKGETHDRKFAERGLEISSFHVSFGKSDGRKSLKKLEQQLKDGKELGAEVAKLDTEDNDQTFKIKKYVDRSTVRLIHYYNVLPPPGKPPPFRSAVVSSYRAGGGKYPYLTVTFGSVQIKAYEISMSEPLPTEDVTFAFGQCQVEYWSQDEAGQPSTLRGRYAYDFSAGAVWTPPTRI